MTDENGNTSKLGTYQQGFNRQLASQLRPGMVLADAKRVWGSKWQAPSRTSSGLLIGRDIGVDFLAQIDRHGAIGMVSFSGNFPSKYVIEEMQLGMSLASFQAAKPTMRLRSPQDPESTKYGFTEYVDTLADGCEISASIRNDKVVGISIERPGSEYPSPTDFVPAPEGKYPVPQSDRAAPFVCANLKLAVMDKLREKGAFDLGGEADLAMHVRGRHVDLGDEGYEMLGDVYEYLARYPISDQQLTSIDTLFADPNLDIHRYAWYRWDGEDDAFDLTSLLGIERCSNLRNISFYQMQTPLDLSPLRGLSRLESIGLVELGDIKNISVLLDIPTLRAVECKMTQLDDPRVLDQLESRGVKIVR